jgi:heme-degrading monooxygenase HmoA
MIARLWRGWVRPLDTAAYVEYVERTGIRAYRGTPGNRGAWILHRLDGDRTEIVTLSFWDSREAIRGFAGDDIDRAVFYPEDDRFLIDREEHVHHFEVDEAAPEPLA